MTIPISKLIKRFHNLIGLAEGKELFVTEERGDMRYELGDRRFERALFIVWQSIGTHDKTPISYLLPFPSPSRASSRANL